MGPSKVLEVAAVELSELGSEVEVSPSMKVLVVDFSKVGVRCRPQPSGKSNALPPGLPGCPAKGGEPFGFDSELACERKRGPDCLLHRAGGGRPNLRQLKLEGKKCLLEVLGGIFRIAAPDHCRSSFIWYHTHYTLPHCSCDVCRLRCRAKESSGLNPWPCKSECHRLFRPQASWPTAPHFQDSCTRPLLRLIWCHTPYALWLRTPSHIAPVIFADSDAERKRAAA